ncbi:FtsQ-type POTRA domain-containing protein [Rathayibacter sp. SD072]|uniref:FtsQ-type POTRA domain-containing protein n=1 Tax=Rathayibacter sp. SD072 TaxID=2781731 RepID=UPI001A96117A|nr:FtsQ-type POTRA domain-containing protein [Rathayibacter sp. SD072]MBO0985362.1 FtsQ-type POTRA domain-containing protein [Rathayibacter sp. SD072]
MKRPEGVRRPAPVRAEPREKTPAPASSGEPTEPIRIVAAPPAARLPRPEARPQKGASGSDDESAVPVVATELRRPAAAAGPRGRPAALLSRLRVPGSEQRTVARAARERRRFERGEVRRFTKRARRRRLTTLAIAGSLVLLAIVVAVAAYSPLMAVRTIEISGTSRVDSGALQESLSDQLGVPLTLVDREAVGEELGAYPLIQSYSLQTRPPSTLAVSIVERTPVGVLQNGTRFDLVDSAGVVIETADAAQAGYPALTTPSGGATGSAFHSLARVLLTLPAGLDGQVTAATATTGDDVTLTLSNGAVVMWGGPDRSALKAVVLEKLMAATDPATVTSYDVSSPAAAVVAQR